MTIRLPFNLALLIAALAGALTVPTSTHHNWWPLQIVVLAILFAGISRAATVRRSVLIGWAFGFGWTVCGIYWMFISMHRFGDMSAVLSALAVIALSLFLALFTGIATASAAWFKQRWAPSSAIVLLLVLPSAWTLSEWMRGWALTGFPWLTTGYAHTSSPLAGFAPLLGVYGVSWAVALLAGAVALLPFKKQSAISLVLIILTLGVGYGLIMIDWTQANGQPISVRLLQGNVPQELKFDPRHIPPTLVLYRDMIRQAPADLIATPETAMPLFLHQLPKDYLTQMSQYAQQTNSHILLGLSVSDSYTVYANSVIGITPEPFNRMNGIPYQYRYDKHHLVPFGETIPFGFHWFVAMLNMPLGSFTPGTTAQAPFAIKDQWVLPNICYEDLFGEEIADQISNNYFDGKPPASILLNVSNIAWFGDSIALPQHLQISQMRALETGRPMLRSTNTGTTAVIDPKGRVVAKLAPYTRGTLSASVQGMQGVTPYILGGNWLIVSLTVLLLGIAYFLSRKKL